MKTETIKTKLHKYIDTGDDRLLKMMFAVAKEYNSSSDDYEFSANELDMLEGRRTSRLKGESATYNWDDSKTMITGKKSA